MTAASAPGKIILCGEYAVLDGEPAVVMAVDRRAVARLADDPQPLSAFLRAAVDEVRRGFGSRSAEADAIARALIDTSALKQDGDKLGLGSSAAATVAAIARSLAAAGVTSLGVREKAQILLLASAAHAAAQRGIGGDEGSGADVFAAVAGGVHEYRNPRTPTGHGHGHWHGQIPLSRWLTLPVGFTWVAVWTGQTADTRNLVAAVRAYRDRDPGGYAEHIAPVAGASRAFIAACKPAGADCVAAVAAIASGGAAIAALGAAAGVLLETDAVRHIAATARAAGGAAKPTGAGGGDTVVAAFADPSQASQFRDNLRGDGIDALDLSVEMDGVRLHP